MNQLRQRVKKRLKTLEEKDRSRLAALFLLILSAISVCMALTFRYDNAVPENIYWLSSDVLIVIVSCLLYYGCRKEKDLADQTTKRFMRLIACHGCTYFGDALSCCRSGETFQLLKYPHDLFVGAMEGIPYTNREFSLSPGDCLFVYTDGIPEAVNASEKFFGEERLTAALNESKAGGPEEIIRRVGHAVTRFTEQTPQFDDITMLCFRYNGA